MKYLSAIILFFGLINQSSCQTDNVVTWKNIEWMQGDWVGDGFGGISYETWSPPIEGVMLGTYRHVSEGKNNFFELFTISQNDDGSFVMKLRHFNPDMTAWEDEKGHLIWPLKSHTDNSVTFGPCTYEMINADSMRITLIINNDEKQETEIFNFKKQHQ